MLQAATARAVALTCLAVDAGGTLIVTSPAEGGPDEARALATAVAGHLPAAAPGAVGIALPTGVVVIAVNQEAQRGLSACGLGRVLEVSAVLGGSCGEVAGGHPDGQVASDLVDAGLGGDVVFAAGVSRRTTS